MYRVRMRKLSGGGDSHGDGDENEMILVRMSWVDKKDSGHCGMVDDGW